MHGQETDFWSHQKWHDCLLWKFHIKIGENVVATFLFFSFHCVENNTSRFRYIKIFFLRFLLSGRKTIRRRKILVLKFKTFIYQHVIGVMKNLLYIDTPEPYSRVRLLRPLDQKTRLKDQKIKIPNVNWLELTSNNLQQTDRRTEWVVESRATD